MSFNFENIGIPIAKIIGGLKDKSVLYLAEPSDYDKVKKPLTEIIMDTDGKLQSLPRKKVIEKLYISAPSGSGKSYYAGSWINEYNKMFKDSEVYVFSPIPSDKALDDNNIVRVDLDEHFIENPIEVEELVDSLVVFDDIENVKNKIMLKTLNNLRDDILQIGRHYRVRQIFISHLISNYADTRRLLNESTSVTVFPRSGSGTYQIKQFLKNQCGLSRTEISKFLNQKSRWVSIYRTFPAYVISEKSIYFPIID